MSGYGSDPSQYPYLLVFAPGTVSHATAEQVATYDGGTLWTATVAFTAPSTGTFYIEAWDPWEYGGDYQLTVNAHTFENLEEWAYDEIAHQLTDGYWQSRSWDTSSDNIITYNINSISPAYQQFAVKAFALWSAIADIEFESTDGSADITFSDTNDGAYSRSNLSFDDDDVYITSSQINIASDWSGDDYTLHAFIHEIGHSLGLGHAGNYNGQATYGQTNEGDALFLNDSWQVSIMSYFHQGENTYVDASPAYLLTPMMADIIAITNLYGAATDTNLGNSIYGYNNNTGNANYDASVLDNTGTPYALTIVDHGGIDTIDLSGTTQARN